MTSSPSLPAHNGSSEGDRAPFPAESHALHYEQRAEAEGQSWYVNNRSDKAASIIEDLKKELPADYDGIEWLYIGGYHYEHDTDSCTTTWRDLYYSTASKEFTLHNRKKGLFGVRI